jgi:ribosome biogenesis protein UTP30
MTAAPATPHSLSTPLVSKALASLVASLSTSEDSSDLLASSGRPSSHVCLTLSLSKVPSGSPKPSRVEVPNPVLSEEGDTPDSEVCLIVKDESKPWVSEYVDDAHAAGKLPFIRRVLSLSKLRKDFSTFAQRRELLAGYTHFLADDRILPMLSKALGKSFYAAKKLPVPVKLTRTEKLRDTLERAVERSTYL